MKTVLYGKMGTKLSAIKFPAFSYWKGELSTEKKRKTKQNLFFQTFMPNI